MQDTENNESEQLIAIDLARYTRAVWKYKWVIAAIVAVGVTVTVFRTNRETEIYSATASILIEPRPPDLLGQQIQEIVPMGAGANWWTTNEYYQAQLKILSSYSLVRRTVEANDLHTRLLALAPDDERTREELIDHATKLLQDQLAISYPDKNRIVYVTVRSADPALAAEIANAHVDSYVSYNLGLRSEGTELASQWLAREFDVAEGALRQSETELFEFKRENDILSVSLEDRQNMVANNIQRYTDALNDARTRRIELGALLSRMREAVQGENLLESTIFSLSENPAINDLKVQYYLEHNNLLELQNQVGPKNHEYQQQKRKVDDLMAALQLEASIVVKATEERHKAARDAEDQFGREVERYKEEAFALGPKEVEYNRLQRREDSNEAQYSIVLERLRASDLTSRLTTINVRQLDRARVPESPVYPSLRRNVVIASAVSMFLGIGLALLLGYLDRSVKSADDVKHATDAPLLGIIPIVTSDDGRMVDQRTRDLYVYRNPTSTIAECCRSLRTNLMFSGADRALQSLVIVSPNPREGKTTSVMYIGTTMAQSGQKVLLIDTDMRRPRLHESTGVPRQQGLTNLVLHDVDYEDVIKSTEVPNLYVLPCGPLPPNPAELVMTNAFMETLEGLKKRFDRILLDSPPLLAVTDAAVLSRLTDGVIMVARAGKTHREQLARTARQLRAVDATIVGVVLNEFNIRDREHGSYYRYYYQKYELGPDEPAKAESA